MRAEPGEGGEPVERHIEVRRSARYWTLGGGERAAETWLVLHGHGQLARRFLGRFAALAGPSRLVVAPEALSRFYVGSGQGRHGPNARVGATWMTREDREAEIRDYLAYLDRLAEAVAPPNTRLTVLGFSQGVATAWRWVTHGRAEGLVRLVAWAGEVPPDLELEWAASALEGREVVLVRGADDPIVPADRADDARSRLERARIAFRAVEYSGGHDIDEPTLLAIAGGVEAA